MPKYVNTDALEAYIKDYACIPCKEYGADKDGIRCDFCGFGFCLEGIKRHTAHDAEPVRHGHWKDSSNGWTCSICNRDVSRDYNYCPNCGAKMDEEEEDE